MLTRQKFKIWIKPKKFEPILKFLNWFFKFEQNGGEEEDTRAGPSQHTRLSEGYTARQTIFWSSEALYNLSLWPGYGCEQTWRHQLPCGCPPWPCGAGQTAGPAAWPPTGPCEHWWEDCTAWGCSEQSAGVCGLPGQCWVSGGCLEKSWLVSSAHIHTHTHTPVGQCGVCYTRVNPCSWAFDWHWTCKVYVCNFVHNS